VAEALPSTGGWVLTRLEVVPLAVALALPLEVVPPVTLRVAIADYDEAI